MAIKPNHDLKKIAKTLSGLSAAEIEQFFKAFLTPKERETLEGRINLVGMLMEGHSQRNIIDELGVSFSQINRGSHELQYGIGKTFFPKFFA